jgi:hypothetical protein
MAHELVQHLNDVMGWGPAFEADVMNGYGAGGDVANGGFEEVAPFGGYGWRYYADTGVDRVAGAAPHSGQYFLRLAGGAASHQPNPAMGGDTFTVKAWVRGATNQDKLHMTIDFRDQNMWTAPLWWDTQTFDLSTSWTQVAMSATAPEAGPNPVFHTRLTFRAAGGSTVDIDDVSMQVDGELCLDFDEDGFGDPGSSICPNGSAPDCNDGDFLVYPGAEEVCTGGEDDNCNGLIDDDDPDCSPATCAMPGESCSNSQDCCVGRCSKGKPSTRVCL